MTVAALYDIHGNLPALEAVIEDIRRDGVDQVVIGGDVLPGPMPRESLDYLLELEIPIQFISGNGDRVVLDQIVGKASPEVPEQFQPVIRWNAKQLSAEHQRFVASWPQTLGMNIPPHGEVLFCHATPRNDTEIFTRFTPEDLLFHVFAGVKERLVVCGHTHMQFDREVGNLRVVNAGSVGMPFGEPGAYWLFIGSKIELRRTDYDLAKAAERIRRTAYPQAEDFATRSVMQPPSERAMLQAWAKAELK
ncbi:MAG TPA: metallophosphoesterase family protein [Terriglobales bacterium]|nr:metallophosphoesterase family protein [Terriglobales bacterium]